MSSEVRSSGLLAGGAVSERLRLRFPDLRYVWLTRANNAITWWKVLIPVFTIVVLLATHFHVGNFTAGCTY